MRQSSGPFIVGGLGFLLESLVVYFVLQAGAVGAAISVGTFVLGLWMLLTGLGSSVVPSRVRYAILLSTGFALIIEGGNLLWSLGQTIQSGSSGGYYLPFMAANIPWYVAGDLGILLAAMGGILVFVGGWGFGRHYNRR